MAQGRSAEDRRTALARGHEAEAFVAAHLEGAGWQVLARNWRGEGGELDLVVERDGAIRFVEVKQREPEDPVGLEAVDRGKQRRLVRAAEAWLATSSPAFHEAAFMVVLVVATPEGFQLDLVDDAFDA